MAYDLTAHEKFLRGEPLTPELAALREGRDPQTTKPRPAPAERRAYDDLERELSRPERLDLKEFWEMEGRKLYQRLAEKAVYLHQKRAIALSLDDPLGSRDEVAAAWAYVKMFKRVVAELDVFVRVEIAELENEQ
jgi:hypothetical protein